MNDNHQEPDTIVTAKIRRGGNHVKTFIKPKRSELITLPSWKVDELRKCLKENVRVVFYDEERDVEICDFYNCLNKDGNLEPCSRALGEFKKSCIEDYAEGNVKVAIKHRGTIIGQEGYLAMRHEMAHRARCQRLQRQRVVPRRVVKAQCPNCGNVFDVELAGFGN